MSLVGTKLSAHCCRTCTCGYPRQSANASGDRGRPHLLQVHEVKIRLRAEPVSAPQKNDRVNAGASKRTRGRAAGARFDRADAECFRQLHAKREMESTRADGEGSRRAHRQNAVADVSSRFAIGATVVCRRNSGCATRGTAWRHSRRAARGTAWRHSRRAARGTAWRRSQSKAPVAVAVLGREVASDVLRVNLRRLERSRSRRLRRRGRDVHEQAEKSDGARTRHLG